jgi:GH18 family chitinase
MIQNPSVSPLYHAHSNSGPDAATAAKGAFIRDQGLLGFAMWESVGDYDDLLLDAIENGMGIGEAC